MRLIGAVENEKLAFRFYAFLQSKNIDSLYEETIVDHKASYQIWVYEEDRLEEAVSYFNQFVQHPENVEFDVKVIPKPLDEEAEEMIEADRIQEIKQELHEQRILRREKSLLTRFLILICAILFFFNTYQRYEIIKATLADNTENKDESELVIFTPIDKALLFDFPIQDNKENIWPGFTQITQCRGIQSLQFIHHRQPRTTEGNETFRRTCSIRISPSS
jgi:hypothetical protein